MVNRPQHLLGIPATVGNVANGLSDVVAEQDDRLPTDPNSARLLRAGQTSQPEPPGIDDSHRRARCLKRAERAQAACRFGIPEWLQRDLYFVRSGRRLCSAG